MAPKRAFAGAALACSWLIFIAEASCKTAIWPSFKCPGALYVFGDSLSDTGNLVEALPFRADAENPPYGSTFFGAPSGRFSDGRLIVDFLASAFGFPFIDPYFKNIASDYRRGTNFAVSGATALNVTGPDQVPLFLPVQTDQFIRFKTNVIAASVKHPQDCLKLQIPTVDSFGSGLYLVFIGSNDILNGFRNTSLSPSTVKEMVVPRVVKAISKSIKDLNAQQARNFFIFNVPPFGCIPYLLTVASLGPFNSKDKYGCLEEYNKVVEYYNGQLERELSSLGLELPEATITSVDIYQFMFDIIANPAKYGFEERTKLTACCGHGGGPYNFDISIPCGNQEAKACRSPNKYISWDGVHFTEGFGKQFVKEMLKGNYLQPSIELSKACHLHIPQF